MASDPLNLIEDVSIILEGINDPGILKAVFMAGGSGSGKSHVAKELFGLPKDQSFTPDGLKLINTDPIYELMLKQHGLSTDLDSLSPEDKELATSTLPGSIFSRAQRLRDVMLRRALKERNGVMIDGTAQSVGKTMWELDALKKRGYDVHMVLVNTSLETALRRNRARKRKLPDAIITKIWNRVQNNIENYKKIFGDRLHIIDNEDDGVIADEVRKSINKFMREPVKNPIGRRWIREKSKGQPVGANKKYRKKKVSTSNTDAPPVDTPLPSTTPKVSAPTPELRRAVGDVLDKKIQNPNTGKQIKVSTAYYAGPEHPAYNTASKMVKAAKLPIKSLSSQIKLPLK